MPEGHEYTQEELAELQALIEEKTRRVAGKDIVLFANSLGITPDAWQIEILRWTGKRLLLNCSRQSGKSTTAAILALHRALYTPKSLILVISPSERQSKELLRKVSDFISRLPIRPKLDKDNTLSVEFENGSRIISLPASERTVRGFSAVTLLIEDEAGDVPDELYRAVRPMLATTDGAFILMGTPKGRRGHFFATWDKGGPAWKRIQVTAHQIPRITAEFLAEERQALGAEFAQEYECQFTNVRTGLVYSGYDSKNLIQNLPNEPGSRWTYILGLDFGIVDQNAVSVLAWRDHDPTVYVVESFRLTAIPSEMARKVLELDKRYKFAKMVGDTGGQGKAFTEEMRQRYHIPIEPADKQAKIGNISLLNGDLQRSRIKLVERTTHDLVTEWSSLPWADGGTREADGYNNHASDATLYAFRACNAWSESPLDTTVPTQNEVIRQQTEKYWEDEQQARMQETQNADWWD